MIKGATILSIAICALPCSCAQQRESKFYISKAYDLCINNKAYDEIKLKYGIDAAMGEVYMNGKKVDIYIGGYPNISDKDFKPPINLGPNIVHIFSYKNMKNKKYTSMYAYGKKYMGELLYTYVVLKSNLDNNQINFVNHFGNSLVRCSSK